MPASWRWEGSSRRDVVSSVAALFAVQLLTALVPFGVGAIAPIVRDRFDVSRGEVGLATTAVFASVALLSIPMGRLADRVGVPRSLAFSSVVVGVAAAGVGTTDHYGVLLAMLALAGVGYAAISPATNKGVLIAVPPRSRGRAMGVKQMGVTAGGVVAAAILPASIQRIGWRPTFFVTGAAIAGLGGGASFAYRAVVRRRAATSLAPTGGPSASTGRLLGLGVIVGTMVAAQHATATHLTLYLVDERGLRIAAAAGFLTVLHTSGTIGRLAWGYASDRLPGGRWRTVAILGASSVAGLVLLAAAGTSLPSPLLVLLVVGLGISTQGGNAVFQAALAEEDEERAGRASGIGMSVGFTGAILAPPAFGAVVDATGTYTIPLLATALVVAIGATAALRVARPAPHQPLAIVEEAHGSRA